MKSLTQIQVKTFIVKDLKKRKETLPFTASLQHVKNVDIMLQCDECGLWRLLYSQKKLTKRDRLDL